MTAKIVATCLLLLVTGCAPGSEPEAEPRGAAQSTSGWTTKAPASSERTEVTATRRGRSIYVAGGFVPEGDSTTATVEVYSIDDDSWRAGPDLPVAVNHAMSATAGGRVYVVGGYQGPGLSNPTRRAFVLRAGAWSPIPRMPAVRAAAAAVGLGGKIYVVGGVTGNGLAAKTFVFNPRSNRWLRRPGLLVPRHHLGVARNRGRIYAVAGRAQGGGNLTAFERYNPKTRTWKTLNPVPTARSGNGAAATSNGWIVAMGGEGPGGTIGEVEAWDVAKRRWRTLPDMPTPRHGLGVVALRLRVFTLAGGPQPGFAYSDANEVLRVE